MSKIKAGKFYFSGQVPTFSEGIYAAHPLDSIMRDIILKNHGRTIVEKAAKPRRPYRRWHKFDRKDPKTWPPSAGEYRIKIKPNHLDFQSSWTGERWMTLLGDGYAETADPWGWTFCDEFDY